ncbi:MAG: filamentous hemagglutinin N-terminal domain-containing protein [Cocleimonas sp.]|nr:filamentous hemagglutinin N-terminal domain-containing protein [Cocleimonas sp.]
MRNQIDKSHSLINLVPAYTVAFSVSVAFTSLAHASPSGANVVSGNVDIHQTSNYTTINQHTNAAIINWQKFGIQRGETVEFVQLNSNSVVLNRVVGRDRSVIDGALRANGKVFVINRQGILFGKNAQVNVGGLVATTSDISNANFLNRLYKFNKPSTVKNASVINRGNITIKDAGLAILVAPSVENHGKIVARLGKVVLGSANSFTLDLYGDELISFDVTKQVANGRVKNTGTISANGGQVLISAQAARNAVDDVISLGGLVEAKAIGAHKGQVILAGSQQGIVNITGKIDVSGKAKGQKGGSVHITGEKIGLAKTAVVDARGHSGGGQIRIGKTPVTTIKNNPRKAVKPIKPAVTKPTKAPVKKAPVDPFYADALAVLNGSAKSTAKNIKKTAPAKPAKQVAKTTKLVSKATAVTKAKTTKLTKTAGKQKRNKADINADFFYMAQQALLDASATETGNGGEVVIHTKEASRVHGKIKATGGAKSGNGGFVETSANKFLNVTNAPDVSATKGKGGTWLLDPNNIEIVEDSIDNANIDDGDATTDINSLNKVGPYTSTGDTAKIKVGVIKEALKESANIVIETADMGTSGDNGGADGTQVGNIEFNAELDFKDIGTAGGNTTGEGSLTLKAHNNIIISKKIHSSTGIGILNLTLNADKDANTVALDGATGGNVEINNKINLNGGDLVTTGIDYSQTGAGIITANNVTINNTGTVALGQITATNLNVTQAGGAVTNTGILTIAGLTDITATGQNITLNNAGNDFNTIKVTGAAVEINDTTGIDLGASTTDSLTVTATDAITDSGVIVTGAGDFTAADGATKKDITLDSDNEFDTIKVSGAAVVINDADVVAGIDIGASTASSLTVTAKGAITDSGVIVTGAGDFTAVNGAIKKDITLDSDNEFDTIKVSGAAVVINDADVAAGIDLGASTASSLTVTAKGAITDSGVIVTGAGDFTAADGATKKDITLDSNNEFDTIKVSGAAVVINDADVAAGIDLGGSTASSLTVTAKGAITDSGVIVTGAGDFTAVNGATKKNITLDSNNEFDTIKVSGAAVVINDADGIDLGASTADSLILAVGGAVTQSGKQTITGITAIDAGTNDITLNDVANNFGTVNIIAGDNIKLADANDIVIGDSAITGNLTVTAVNDVFLGATTTSAGSINVNAGDDLVLTGNTYHANGDLILVAKNANASDATHNGIVLKGTGPILSSKTGKISFNDGFVASRVTILNDTTLSVTTVGDLTLGSDIFGEDDGADGVIDIPKEKLTISLSDGNIDINALNTISGKIDADTIDLGTETEHLYVKNDITWSDTNRNLDLIGTKSVTIADDIAITSTQKSIIINAQDGVLSLGDNKNELAGIKADDNKITIKTNTLGESITFKSTNSIKILDGVTIDSQGGVTFESKVENAGLGAPYAAGDNRNGTLTTDVNHNVSINTKQSFTISKTITDIADLTITSDNSVIQDKVATITTKGDISIDGGLGNNLDLNGDITGRDILIGEAIGGGASKVDATGNWTAIGKVDVDGKKVTVTKITASGADGIDLKSSGADATDDLTLNGDLTTTVGSAGSIKLTSTTGSITGGANKKITSDATIDLDATAKDIQLDGTHELIAKTGITADAVDIVIGKASTTTSGNIDVTAIGDVTVVDALDSKGNVIIDGGVGKTLDLDGTIKGVDILVGQNPDSNTNSVDAADAWTATGKVDVDGRSIAVKAIEAGGAAGVNLKADGGDVKVAGAVVSSNGAADVILISDKNISIISTGSLGSEKSIKLDAGINANIAGDLSAGTHIDVDADEKIDHTLGNIVAGGKVTFDSKNIVAGNIKASGAAGIRLDTSVGKIVLGGNLETSTNSGGSIIVKSKTSIEGGANKTVTSEKLIELDAGTDIVLGAGNDLIAKTGITATATTDADGSVTLGSATTTGAGSNIVVTANKDVTTKGALNAKKDVTLTAGAGGALAINGDVTAGGKVEGTAGLAVTQVAAKKIDATGDVTLTGSSVSSGIIESDSAAGIELKSTVGEVTLGGDLKSTVGGIKITSKTDIEGGSGKTLDAKTALTLSAEKNIDITGSTLKAGTGITATATTDADGSVTLGSATTTDAGSNIVVTANKDVTTKGALNAKKDVTLIAGTSGALAINGDVTAGGKVEGTAGLVVTLAATKKIDATGAGSINLKSNAITLKGNIDSDEGALIIDGKSTLGSSVSLAGKGIELKEVAGGGNDLTITDSAITKLQGVINGVKDLMISGSDVASTEIGAGITTTGSQTYDNKVVLKAASITLASSSATENIVFNDVLDGASDLTVNNKGNTIFNKVVGAGTALTSITTDKYGATLIKGGSVTTKLNQIYNDKVIIGSDTATTEAELKTTLSTLEGKIYFGSTTNPLRIFGNRNNAEKEKLILGLGDNSDLTDTDLITNQLDNDTNNTNNNETIDGVTYKGVHLYITKDQSGTADFEFSKSITIADDVEISSSNGITFTTDILSLGDNHNEEGFFLNDDGETYVEDDNKDKDISIVTSSGNILFDANEILVLDGVKIDSAGGVVFGDIKAGVIENAEVGGSFTSGVQNSLGELLTDRNHNLSVKAGDNIVLKGAIGEEVALGSFTTTGSTEINGGTVNTVKTTNSSIVAGQDNSSTGDQIYDGTVVLNNATTLTSSGGNITFKNTVDGTQDLTLDAKKGNIDFLESVGGNTALGVLVINSDTLKIGGNITTDEKEVFIDSDVTLTNTVVIKTGLGVGDISFKGTVDGAQDLTLSAGTGNIDFVKSVGSLAALNNLKIVSAKDVTAVQSIKASSLTQLAGTGLTNLKGTVETAGALDLTTQEIKLEKAIETTAGGTVSLDATTITLASDADITADGAVTIGNKDTVGVLNTGGDIKTSNDAITIHSGTTLTDKVAIDTGTGAGDIRFKDTLDGKQNLSLTAGTGDIEFVKSVGSFTALNDIKIASAKNVTARDRIEAKSLVQQLGTGLTQLKTVKTEQININSQDITLGGDLEITKGGDVTLKGDTTLKQDITVTTTGNAKFDGKLDGNNRLTVNADKTTSFEGAVNIGSLATNAKGTTKINGGSITTKGEQTYNDKVELGADTTLKSKESDITLANTIDGLTHALEIIAKKGSAFVKGSASNVGDTKVSAKDVVVDGEINTTGNGSIELLASNKLDINKSLTADGSGKIDLQGDSLNLGGGNITSDEGDTKISAKDVVIDGEINTTGNGSIELLASNKLDINKSLTANGSGKIELQGGSLNLGGGNIKSDEGDITIKSDATLDGALDVTTKGNVSFNGALTGDKSLRVNADKTTTFNKAVNIGSLVTNEAGKTVINGGSVTTTEAQVFNDKVELGADTTLKSSKNSIILNEVVAKKLIIEAKEDITTGKLTASGDVSLDAGHDINTNGEVRGNKISLNAKNDITTSKLTASDDVTLDAGNNIKIIGEVNGGEITLEAKQNITTDSLNAKTDTLTISAGNNFLSDDKDNPSKLQAKNKVSINSKSGSTTITGNIESTDGDVEILANTNELITVKGNIKADNGAVTIAKAGDIKSFDLDGKITAKKDIIIHRDLMGAAITLNSVEGGVTLQEINGSGILSVAAVKIKLNGDISTDGAITFNGPVKIEDGAPSEDIFTIASNGGDIEFDSIDAGLSVTLNLNAAKDTETGGEINGAVTAGDLNLAGSGGNLTGVLGTALAVGANDQEMADSIRFIPEYKFGEFYFNGELATLGFSPDLVRIIIRGVAPLKTVLNDKLFSAGLSKGKLDEDMTASDAKISDSKGAEPEKCGDKISRSKEIVEARGWSLLGVKADIDTKVKDDKCEKKSDDIQAKTEKAVNES